MTKVSVKKSNLKIVMIDGYVPAYEHFMRNRQFLRKKGVPISEVLHRYSPHGQLSENRLLLYFGALVSDFRQSFCREKFKDQYRTKHRLCGETYYATKNNWHSIESAYRRIPIFKKHLHILQNEYRREQDKGINNYVQNVVFCDTNCRLSNECSEGWCDLYYFDIKHENQYENPKFFKLAWEDILTSFFQRFFD